jgi:hypothetical protein
LSKRTYGILAGMIGSALGAWWWSRRRSSGATAARERGAVIYDNTPMATELADGVI